MLQRPNIPCATAKTRHRQIKKDKHWKKKLPALLHIKCWHGNSVRVNIFHQKRRGWEASIMNRWQPCNLRGHQCFWFWLCCLGLRGSYPCSSNSLASCKLDVRQHALPGLLWRPLKTSSFFHVCMGASEGISFQARLAVSGLVTPQEVHVSVLFPRVLFWKMVSVVDGPVGTGWVRGGEGELGEQHWRM